MTSSKKALKNPKGLFNKYTLTIIGFLVWLTFFDQYNLIGQYNLNRSIAKLDMEKVNYQSKMEEAKNQKKIMDSDIERFAREKHYMHKDNEEVIIIERSEKK